MSSSAATPNSPPHPTAESPAARVLVINGPNINLLGQRDAAIYGSETLDDLENLCVNTGAKFGIAVRCYQSNSEGDIITAIHKAIEDREDRIAGIVINAGAYSHTSYAIRDALEVFSGRIIEVHLSNIYRREEFRHHSVLSEVAQGVIVGLGFEGYVLAISAMALS